MKLFLKQLFSRTPAVRPAGVALVLSPAPKVGQASCLPRVSVVGVSAGPTRAGKMPALLCGVGSHEGIPGSAGVPPASWKPQTRTRRRDAGARGRAKASCCLCFVAVMLWFCSPLCLPAADTNAPTPVTARDFYNTGTRLLATKKYSDAEKMFQSSLLLQDEGLQSRVMFNLGHTRFADGAEILAKGPDAQKTLERGNAALAAGADAVRAGEAALASEQMDQMIMAYIRGRGARHELNAAQKVVKTAMETYGRTLAKWKRAADDFHGAAELNPDDANAAHNAEVVERAIAELVDQQQKLMEMNGALEGQKQALGKTLSKLKGKIPAADAPPGENGEDGDEGEKGVKPESLAGREENASRDGDQVQTPLSPEVAGQILDGLSVDGTRRLPMSDQSQGPPPKDRHGRNW